MYNLRSYLAINEYYLVFMQDYTCIKKQKQVSNLCSTLHFGIYGRVPWQIANNPLDLPRMGSTEVCHQNVSLHLRSHKSFPLPRGPRHKQAYSSDSLRGSYTQNIPTVCFLLLSPCHIFFLPRGSTCYYGYDTWKAAWVLQETARSWVDSQGVQWIFFLKWFF